MVLHASYLQHSKGIIPLSQMPNTQTRRFGSYLLPRSGKVGR